MSKQNCTDTISLQQSPDLPTTQDVVNGAAGHLTAAFGRLMAWQRRAEMRHRLASLDDHMLADMGLTRADVDAEVTKPFWRA